MTWKWADRLQACWLNPAGFVMSTDRGFSNMTGATC